MRARWLLALLCGCGRVGFDPNGDAAADPSLVGWWQFDDMAGVTAHDSSNHGNDGTLLNGAIWGPGHIRGALVFDGVDDLVRVAQSSSLVTPDTMTVAMWANGEARASGINFRMAGYVGSWELKLNYESPQLTSDTGSYAIASLSFAANEWHHVAMTYDRGQVTFYVDGIPSTLSTNTFAGGEVLAAGTELDLGDNVVTGVPWHGSLDDIRLYNRVLPAAEIASLANE